MSLLDRCPVAREIFELRSVPDQDGRSREVHSTIRSRDAEALYRTVLGARPARVVEVGMAFGGATIAILTALREAGNDGRLVSIDPYQSERWGGCGVTSVARAGFSDLHELIEEPDYLALPRLLERGSRLDFAYLDGWHSFDYTLLDFWYVDRMLPAGGVVGFNDCGWRSVQKVIRFVETHRRYEEIDVGLRSRVPLRREIFRLLRGRIGRAHRVLSQDRYFRKREEWEPRFDFFREF